jgi:DNA polymerase-4
VSSEATILHADLDAFFASVAQRDYPRLRGRPVIVGSGVVMAASYEARAFGVRSAMGGDRARRLCPDAVFVNPDFDAYAEASRQVFRLFRRTAPDVEGLSIDEAFLDVRGLERIAGTPSEIAVRLRREVRERVGLPITVGVARTKSLAKVASNEAKPDGLLVVAAGPEPEREFLWPLPVERLWGVGPATARRLHDRQIHTVGQLAARPASLLVAEFGRATGEHLHRLANGVDPRPVRARRGRRSFGSQSARRRTGAPITELETVVASLVERVTRRMRKAGRVGRTVVLRLRFDDYSRASRSRTLPRATAATEPILAEAKRLLRATAPVIERRGTTMIGISIANLDGEGAGEQLELPLDGPHRGLDRALDELSERFGTGVVLRAGALHAGEPAPWLFVEQAGESAEDAPD